MLLLGIVTRTHLPVMQGAVSDVCDYKRTIEIILINTKLPQTSHEISLFLSGNHFFH